MKSQPSTSDWLSESTASSLVRLEGQILGEARECSCSEIVFLISNSYATHICPSEAGKLDPELDGHYTSPVTRIIAMTGLPAFPAPSYSPDIAAKILQGWPGLTLCLVLASPVLPATMQLCVHMENFFPKAVPSAKVCTLTILNCLQISRLYHLQGLSSSMPILQQ